MQTHTVRYIDDIASFWSNALMEVHAEIYPSSLPLTFSNCHDKGNYLDVSINLLSYETTVYDKRRDFAFEVLRIPEKKCNQPCRIGLGAFFSQCIRIARITSTKKEFEINFMMLIDIMHKRGYCKQEIVTTSDKLYRQYRMLLYKCQIRKKSILIHIINQYFV